MNKQIQRLFLQNRGYLFANSSLFLNRSCTTQASSNVSEHSQSKTFQELLDESPIMKFGRPDNKCLVGKITDVCNDDLYIDFGGKFEAVLKRPEEKANFYRKGSLVRILLRKFEMTGAFLGDPRHITLCEADALLVGPYSKKFEQRRKKDNN
ncbi:small ribosomal subunit protein bS1m-like [Clytia hemisphaerica]|uniref:28S ribosomal protein S28, mitochondrial n=1 Tax=Clytia hemisphaerica TaxID=252671 RepID=A0A7M5UFJ5_9CNID